MNDILKQTILVVDDMELNREILEMILEDSYRVLKATNGLEAYRILEQEAGQIALILLDIVMPLEGGFDFLKRVQKSEQYKNIPIIFVTSETYAENILEGVKLGVRDVIAKPFEPDVVLGRVANVIAPTGPQVKKTAAGAAASKSSPPLRRTVLIADAVTLNRLLLKKPLEGLYDILEAGTDKEALALLEQHNQEIAVVLLAVAAPGLDGYHVMREAKNRELLERIPVIGIVDEDAQSVQAKRLGISDVIVKPIDPAIVKTKVNYMKELYRKF